MYVLIELWMVVEVHALIRDGVFFRIFFYNAIILIRILVEKYFETSIRTGVFSIIHHLLDSVY